MTHTAKHTPGPLHNVTGHKPGPWIRQVLNDESEAYIHDKHCNAIARVYSLSDAALIAAAPAMYQELVKQRDWLLHIMKQVQAPASVMLDFEQSIKYLNLTIAQAEGIVK